MSIFYNVQHSPIGAFASFTLGAKGAKGGLGLELGKPADQNVFIGYEREGVLRCLPFHDHVEDEFARFEVGAEAREQELQLEPFREDEITRTLGVGCDHWQAPGLSLAIHSPAMPIPDPDVADAHELKQALAPVVLVEMEIDNSQSDHPARCVFGFQGRDEVGGMRLLEETCDASGIAAGLSLAIAGKRGSVEAGLGFTAADILKETYDENRGFGIGTLGLLTGKVPARSRQTFQFVVCFHKAGLATSGMDSRYFYTRFFPKIEDVATYALEHFEALKQRSAWLASRIDGAPVNADRKFMFCHALHSYFGSTELLDTDEGPIWIVNEGEYRMMNTLDLTADQVYFETQFNPWAVWNELDWFVRRYSYEDKLRFPGEAEEHPGGLSFTHDMGIANHFTPPGRSVYEKHGLSGCFSHMTQEELINWMACFLQVDHATDNTRQRERFLPVLHRCLDSMLQRDHVDPERRDGIMSMDSSRCAGGAEITTYDSLDVSLGQARNNLYLAVRAWGLYVGLQAFFTKQDDPDRAEVCRLQASRIAKTVAASANDDGTLPAILHENVQSRIIPAIEGLALPHVLGLDGALDPDGPYGHLILALKAHLRAVLKAGVCLFDDGGWKISSTSDNSWLSKVYLCQHVAEQVLQWPGREDLNRADAAHRNWLLHEDSLYWAWSDQMVKGVAHGSKYYPRGVTSILWFGSGAIRW